MFTIAVALRGKKQIGRTPISSFSLDPLLSRRSELFVEKSRLISCLSILRRYQEPRLCYANSLLRFHYRSAIVRKMAAPCACCRGPEFLVGFSPSAKPSLAPGRSGGSDGTVPDGRLLVRGMSRTIGTGAPPCHKGTLSPGEQRRTPPNGAAGSALLASADHSCTDVVSVSSLMIQPLPGAFNRYWRNAAVAIAAVRESRLAFGPRFEGRLTATLRSSPAASAPLAD